MACCNACASGGTCGGNRLSGNGQPQQYLDDPHMPNLQLRAIAEGDYSLPNRGDAAIRLLQRALSGDSEAVHIMRHLRADHDHPFLRACWSDYLNGNVVHTLV